MLVCTFMSDFRWNLLLKNSWECRESNLGLLGAKQERYPLRCDKFYNSLQVYKCFVGPSPTDDFLMDKTQRSLDIFKVV